MSRYRIGCCVPGASFMPEGEAGIAADALASLEWGCDAIIGAGFDYAEAGVGVIMGLTEDQLERAVTEKLPIEACNSFIPPTYKIVADGACDANGPLYRYVGESMRRMAALGVRVVVFGSGGARRIPDGMTTACGREYIMRFLHMCAQIAEKYNVTVAIEPLRALECNAINDVATGAAMAKAVGSSRIAYLADAFHMACGGESADTLTSMDTMPAHIHVSEAPDRVYPGAHGGEYLAAFAEALGKTPYAGRVSVECGFTDFEREVKLAYEFMNKHF